MVMKTFYVKVGYQTHFEADFVACVGYFDGLHLGHMHLLDACLATAQEKQLKSALITFDPDPWETIHRLTYHHLTTIEDRVILAEKLGFDYFIVLTFNQEMAKLPAEVFIKDLLNQLPLKHLICGFDFRYGYLGQGNVESLTQAERNFALTIIPEITFKQEKISTTRIMKLIEQGEIEQANQLLGYPYQIKGTVSTGRSQGKKIGFPTANIAYHPEYVMPAQGVYAGKIVINQKHYLAMISIGHNPTFNYRQDLTLEVNILDFDLEIYGQAVAVEFWHFLRPQIKFTTVEALIDQLKVDQLNTEAYFKSKASINSL